MGKSKEIIRSFVSGPKSPYTRRLFMRWLSSHVDVKEKDEALYNLWETSEPCSGHTERALRRTRARLFKESGASRSKFLKRIAAAAVLVLFLSAGAALFHVSKFTGEVDVRMTECYVPYCSVETVVLADGSKVTLNSGSLLVYPEKFSGKDRQVYLNGEACFDIARDEDKPFIVNTKDFDIEVLGTIFNVSSYPEDSFSAVVLKEGSVRLKSTDSSKEPILMDVNQSVTYDRISGSYTLDNVYADDYLYWRTSGLYFNCQSLENIIRVAERRFGVAISCLNPEKFSSSRITAKFVHQESLEDFLDVLQKLIPEMSYTIVAEGKHIYIQ